MRSLLAIIIAFTAALSVNACDAEGASCFHDRECCYPMICNVSTIVNRSDFIQRYNYVGRAQIHLVIIMATASTMMAQLKGSSFKAGRFVEVIGNAFCFLINSMWLLTPQSISIVQRRLEELSCI
jgi:hypothetical protein